MKSIDLNPLGPRLSSIGDDVHFGVYLPEINSDRFSVVVRIIHEDDQFIQDILPRDFPLAQTQVHDQYGVFWEVTVSISGSIGDSKDNKDHWGAKGRYVYRYQVTDRIREKVIDWVIDPFAREFGSGKMSAFTLGYIPHEWSTEENAWRTPHLHDLVVYELHLGEFANGIHGATDRLNYLADLGVNCIELMPVSNVIETVEWGFQPIGFFGVDDRFGNRRDFQRFVDKAHRLGIAVILDVVFGHTGSNFPFSYLYRELGFASNPFHAAIFGTGFDFGERTNFDAPFVEDFFFTVARHWLDCYHVDGFRFDCVPEYWDPIRMRGYHRIVYNLYQETKTRLDETYWERFKGQKNTISLILCAEQLIQPKDAVNQTYGNCSWQSLTADAAAQVATASEHDRSRAIEALGIKLGLDGFFHECDMNGDHLIKSAFQYIENHDKPRFINLFGEYRDPNYHLYPVGNRENWWMMQPYLIALLLAPGIPMLWQGQELCENNSLPGNGEGRVGFLRPVHWEYFYDRPGSRLLWLVRRLLSIRASLNEFRNGDYYFVNDAIFRDNGLLVFRRFDKNSESVIMVNFGTVGRTVLFQFAKSGLYQELIYEENGVMGQSDAPTELTIPKNDGRVWRL